MKTERKTKAQQPGTTLPAVSFAAWQRGITNEVGARNGQIVAILSLEARRGILTANATTPYYLGFAISPRDR